METDPGEYSVVKFGEKSNKEADKPGQKIKFYKSRDEIQNDNVFDLLLLDQMGSTTSYSTLKMTAVMMTAERLALGMKAQYGMRKARQRMTRRPV